MHRLRRLSTLLVIRPNLLVWALLFWFCRHWSLRQPPGPSVALPLLTMGFLLLLLAFSLAASLGPWCAFLLGRRLRSRIPGRPGDSIRVFFDRAGHQSTSVPVRIEIAGLARPMLALVTVALVFGDNYQSEEVVISARPTGGTSVANGHAGDAGQRDITLPAAGDYRVTQSVIRFTDPFHLFSFPCRETKKLGVYVMPDLIRMDRAPVPPDQSPEASRRVPLRRSVHGELLESKSYEYGDDVRRIIWTIYARNRELMIRIPDRTNTYASRLNVMASFYQGLVPGGGHPALSALLDRYKAGVRSLIEAAWQQGLDARFLPDQALDGDFYRLEGREATLFPVAASRWQRNQDPGAYLRGNAGKISRRSPVVLCLTSLCPQEALDDAWRNGLSGTTVVWYRLSRMVKGLRRFRLQSVFWFEPADRLQLTWDNPYLKRMHGRILRNEGLMQSWFDRHGLEVIVQ